MKNKKAKVLVKKVIDSLKFENKIISLNKKGERLYIYFFSKEQRRIGNELDFIDDKKIYKRTVDIDGNEFEYSMYSSNLTYKSNFKDSINIVTNSRNIKIEEIPYFYDPIKL